MIGFLFFLALQPISRKTECRVNLRYVQVVYYFHAVMPSHMPVALKRSMISFRSDGRS